MPTRVGFIVVSCLVALSALWASGSRAADSVSLGLDWTVDGYHAPFYLGLERGYYASHGIDLSISQGKGSALAVQLVGSGSNTFGFADGAATIKLISNGVPVKVVMGILKKTMMSVVVPADSPIKTPADLKGKKVSVSPGDANGLLLPAFLTANQVPVQTVQLVSVDPSAKYRLMAQRVVDAVAGYGVLAKWTMKKLGMETRQFDFADAGIQVPAFSIVASDTTIKNNPDLVKRFLAATAQSWQAAQQDPQAAIDAMINRYPQIKSYNANFKGKLTSVFAYINTPRTEGKPFGWMSPEDWNQTESILKKYMGLQPAASVGAYFTDDFIPDLPAAKRE